MHGLRGTMRLILLLVLAAAIAACGGGHRKPEDFHVKTPAGERIEIEFWHAMSGGHARSLNYLIDKFNTSQDKYVVRAVYQGGYETLSQKLIAATYAGRPPAISQMYEAWATRFLKADCLNPIQNFVEADKAFYTEGLPDVVSTFQNDSKHRLFRDPESKLWRAARRDEKGEWGLGTMPFNKSVYVLCVNQTLMEEVGYQEAPQTWEQMLDLAQKMTKKDAEGRTTRYGFATRAMIEAFTPFLFAAGTNYMDPDLKDFTFGGSEGQAAFDFLVQLVGEAGYIESDYLNAAFGQERIGMYVSSTASFPYNDSAVGNKFIWRAYPVPERAPGVGWTLAQGTNLGIFRQGYTAASAIPKEVQDGAWEFVKFLIETDNTVKWSIDTGYLPVRYSAAKHPDMIAHWEKNINAHNAYLTIERALFEPKPTWWDNVRNILGREVESVLNGRKKAKDGLDSAIERAELVRSTAAS